MKTKCEKCGETESLSQNEVRDYCDGNGGAWEVDDEKIDTSKPGWSATGICPRCQDERRGFVPDLDEAGE